MHLTTIQFTTIDPPRHHVHTLLLDLLLLQEDLKRLPLILRGLALLPNIRKEPAPLALIHSDLARQPAIQCTSIALTLPLSILLPHPEQALPHKDPILAILLL